LHWLFVIEGIFLTLTGFQLGGGMFGITFFPTNNLSYHVMLGIAVIATVTLFMYDITAMGLLFWWGPKKIPYSNRFVIAEFKAWFKLGSRPVDPILYNPKKKDYVEKIIPSVVVSFWTFTILGSFLMVTGLMLAFPAQFFFFYYIFNPVGQFLTGVSGVPFALAIHRLAAELLVILVALHVYAVFVFKLVKSMITGKRDERILQ
jgi:formate dehydrogenase subunit gamma